MKDFLPSSSDHLSQSEPESASPLVIGLVPIMMMMFASVVLDLDPTKAYQGKKFLEAF